MQNPPSAFCALRPVATAHARRPHGPRPGPGFCIGVPNRVPRGQSKQETPALCRAFEVPLPGFEPGRRGSIPLGGSGHRGRVDRHAPAERVDGGSPPGVLTTTTNTKRMKAVKIKTFGSADERSLKQLERCMDAGDDSACCAPTITRAAASRSAARSPTRATFPRQGSATTSAAATRRPAPS